MAKTNLTRSSLPFPTFEALDGRAIQDPSAAQSQPQTPSNASKSSSIPWTHLPGEPTIGLDPESVHEFLVIELGTPILDELYEHLWFVGRKAHDNVDALHRQAIKGRSIIVTEDCKLHMLWHRDKFFVKPVPLCLTNHDFWNRYLGLPGGSQGSPKDTKTSLKVRVIALGFLRSYSYLIRHRSDLELAKAAFLVPKEWDWIEWSRFIANFRNIQDNQVARRYHYGQLRLSRLNWATRLFRPPGSRTYWFYELSHWSTTPYIESFAAPLIFMFASLSLVLSSMQVMLATPSGNLMIPSLDETGIRAMSRAYWVFSLGVVLFSGVSWILLLGVPLTVIIWQLQFGYRRRNGLNDPS